MGQEIKRGAFGCIFKGLYIKKREPVAIKIEYGGIQSLKHEVKIMNYLATSGLKQIPNIYWYGIHNDNPCLVFTLYECSLNDYMEKKNVTIEKMNLLMIKTIDIIVQHRTPLKVLLSHHTHQCEIIADLFKIQYHAAIQPYRRCAVVIIRDRCALILAIGCVDAVDITDVDYYID